MRGAVEIGHQLINLDLITTLTKDYEDDYTHILVSYVGGGSHRLWFDTVEQADKFYDDFKNAK